MGDRVEAKEKWAGGVVPEIPSNVPIGQRLKCDGVRDRPVAPEGARLQEPRTMKIRSKEGSQARRWLTQGGALFCHFATQV